ncbi:S-layer homology domain-containing protein [Clostridiisalibacter paucivorans]|uniref:S-layer homology domain-containing protein n=1 Tax=Clostridiisalibacter paucivorans TaxID=408753 RepID=UPI0004790E8D|nr:S-layer homology domain-containing protein [Clostridiisalibacter paucivorans]
MKRVLSIVLALAMVLGSFSMAFAAAPNTDLVKNIEDKDIKAAVERLSAFSIVSGMGDGEYHPELDVTREQFATLMVKALGLDNAANAAAGSSSFTDVPVGKWSTGYINVAAGQNIIKGTPSGKFLPTKNVTYAEAVTMLVRALGYKDDLIAGNWPDKFFAKAAEKGITKGVKFSTTGSADRGSVALMIDNTLDAEIIKQDTFGENAEYKEEDTTLLKEKLDISKYENVRIVADKLVDDGLEEDEMTVKFLEDVDAYEDSVSTSYRENEVKDFDFEDFVNPRRFIGEEVTLYMDDNDNVIYLEEEKDDKAYFDYVDGVTGKDGEITELGLVRHDDDYKFDEDAVVYVFDSSDNQYDEITVDKRDGIDTDIDDVVGKVGKFVVKNNKIVYAEVMGSDEAYPWMLVLDNNKGLLEGINETDENFDLDLGEDGNYDGVFAFDTLGNKVDVDDIDEGNIIYVQKQDYDGDDYAVVMVVDDNVVEGELGRVKDDRVKIGSKEIKTTRFDNDGREYQSYYSIDGLEDIKQWNVDSNWEDDMEDADDEDVVAYLDVAGRIAFLTTEADATSGFKYGIVTRTYSDNDKIRIFTLTEESDGDEILYEVEEYKNLEEPLELDEFGNDKDATKRISAIKAGEVVKFKLNNNGEIAEDEFYVADKDNSWKMREDRDFGEDSILATSKDGAENESFSIDNKAAIIDGEGLDMDTLDFDSDDFGVANWDDMAEDNYDSELEFFVFTKRSNNIDIDALVFVGKGASSSTDEEAIYVVDKWSKGGDDYVEYVSYETGKVEEAEVDKVSDGKLEKERPYIAEIKSDGTLKLYNKDKGDFDYKTGVITDKDGQIITVDGKDYRMNSKTVAYEEDTKKSNSNFRKDDAVYFVVEDGVNVRVIERLVDDEAEDVKEGTTGGSGSFEDVDIDFEVQSRADYVTFTVSERVYFADDVTNTFSIEPFGIKAIEGPTKGDSAARSFTVRFEEKIQKDDIITIEKDALYKEVDGEEVSNDKALEFEVK